MAIRRGYSYITAVVPTRLKEWVTRKARKRTVSRSRLLTEILEEAHRSEPKPAEVTDGKAARDA